MVAIIQLHHHDALQASGMMMQIFANLKSQNNKVAMFAWLPLKSFPIWTLQFAICKFYTIDELRKLLIKQFEATKLKLEWSNDFLGKRK